MRRQIRLRTEVVERFVSDVMAGQRQDRTAAVVRFGLFLLSKVFNVATKVRQLLYSLRLLTFLLASVAARNLQADGALELVTVDEANTPMPCRVHVREGPGKRVKAPELPFWNDHFVCTGKVSVALSPGEYVYEIE